MDNIGRWKRDSGTYRYKKGRREDDVIRAILNEEGFPEVPIGFKPKLKLRSLESSYKEQRIK